MFVFFSLDERVDREQKNIAINKLKIMICRFFLFAIQQKLSVQIHVVGWAAKQTRKSIT